MKRFSSVLKIRPRDDNKPGLTPNGTQTKNKRQPSKPVPPKKDDRSAKRHEVTAVFEEYAQLIHASQRPLPNQTGDGTYLEHEHHSSLFQDLGSFGVKDFGTLLDVIKNQVAGGLVDDKTMLMEHIIQLVSRLPSNSSNRAELTNAFLDQLWTTLPHPPLSYIGDEYQYRSADGSKNNPIVPWLGAAFTPYARSTAPMIVQPGALPDPGLIFDSVMAREKFKPHPNKVSSVFFAWASLIIHDLFQTDHQNPHISQTSSYLDLSILYGDNQADQDLMRTFQDGRIQPDCYSEARLQAFPPVCSVLLVMLNRFHNYVVEQLAVINENGRFTKPRPDLNADDAKKAWAKYDNDLFQTGRLITCGLYINVTLYDYLRTIVNLNRTNSTWCLDPRARMDKYGKHTTPSGIGNQCSFEFNLAYRWHSATSAQDEVWTENVYKQLFGKPASEVSMPELLMGLYKYEKDMDPEPSKRTFAGLSRQADGSFKDDDLVKILTEAVEEVAGAFGAQNVPKALRSVEILGIQQARKWNCGSLNEFRKFFGLKPHETFEEINSDQYVADQLRNLYEHPDYVELYPGLVSEEAKPPMVPGVGIAPTYTISRAVLSDAVALVRGDRFYTIDANPKNLTNWGFAESNHDLSINQGCVFYKLALRSFPHHIKPNSIYVHYPMTVPSENKNIMKDLGRESHYSWDRPALIPPTVDLKSYPAAKVILESKKDFRATWGEATGYVFGKGGPDPGDSSSHTKQLEDMSKVLPGDQWRKHVKDFYEEITLALLHEKSCKIAGINQVDITRDVGNLAHVHFASTVFSLPLKTDSNPRGIYTEHEMFMLMAVIFTCIFYDLDPSKSFPLRQVSHKLAQQLGQIIEVDVKSVGTPGFFSGLVDGLRRHRNALEEDGVHMIRRLLDNGLGASQIAYSQILPIAAALVPSQSQLFTQIIDYYLSDKGKVHLPDIKRAAKENTTESDEKLLHYCMEGIRLNGSSGVFRESQIPITVDDGGRQVNIKPGDKVFVGFVSAARDPKVFPNPNEVRLDRPLESYLHYNDGPHTYLGGDASRVALTAMLRVVGRLDNLRRVPGPQGTPKKIPRPGGSYVYMKEDYSGYVVFPMTFKVNFDGELPRLSK